MRFSTLAMRNVFRDKVRWSLTVFGVAVAVMTFITLRTAVNSWDMAQELSRKDRIVTRHKVTFVMMLPRRYAEEIRELKGSDGKPLARSATFANWFGGKDPKHDREFFAALAIDASTYFDVYDEIQVPKPQMEAFLKDRSGCIVGAGLAQKFGWKEGDRITLESDIYPAPADNPWTFTISAIYTTSAKSFDQQTFLFHWDRLNDALPEEGRNQVGLITTRPVDVGNAAEFGLLLDRLFDEREIQTLSQDERSFNTSFLGMISSVLDVVSVLSLAILLIMALVLANTLSMGVRERTGEYALLRSLGFRPRHVVALILTEAALTAGTGTLLGVAAGTAFIQFGVGKFFEANLAMFFPIFEVQPKTIGLALAMALLVAVVSAAIPAVRMARLRVQDALRQVA